MYMKHRMNFMHALGIVMYFIAVEGALCSLGFKTYSSIHYATLACCENRHSVITHTVVEGLLYILQKGKHIVHMLCYTAVL